MNVDPLAPLTPGAMLPVPLGDGRLDTPAVLIVLDIVEDNVARMAGYGQANAVDLRPHAKTNERPAMAKRQIVGGALGICVTKASEAEVFARVGIDDMTIAYPVIGEAKLNRLRETRP